MKSNAYMLAFAEVMNGLPDGFKESLNMIETGDRMQNTLTVYAMKQTIHNLERQLQDAEMARDEYRRLLEEKKSNVEDKTDEDFIS